MPYRFALTFVLALSAAHAQDHLRLASGEWPPYASARLPEGGVAEHIISAAFAEAGVAVDYRRLSWKRGYEMARQGKLDGAILWAPPRQSDPDFIGSHAVIQSTVVLFYRKATPLDGTDAATLRNYRYAYPDLYSYDHVPAYRRLLEGSREPPLVISNDEQGLLGLVNERLDVYPADRLVGIYLLNGATHGNWAATVTYQPKPIAVEPLAVLLSRKRDRAAELIARFNDGLAKLQAKGLTERWLAEYGGYTGAPKAQPTP